MIDPPTLPRASASSSKSTTVGWLLWRGGLWFCGVYIGWEGSVRIWRCLLGMELPDPVFVGIVMMLVGSVLVVASLILERIQDARLEAEMLDE